MPAEPVETLRFRADTLELLDQRALPAQVSYVRCRSAEEVAAAIRDMIVRGAPAIGCTAAYGVALAALEASTRKNVFASSLHAAFDLLAASRPTAVNLFWSLARMRACWDSRAHEGVEAIAAALLGEARAIQDEDVAGNQAMGRLGAALLPDPCCVLTHCNAGALATAGHGTALGVVRSAVAAGKRVRVVAGETRPFLQGARLTAWEMQREGIPVTLIADGASGHLMSRGEIDAVIVGADRVAANGDVVNKIGTYMIAVMARRHALPFYVACPISTIDQSTSAGIGTPIEERAAAEVLGFGGTLWAPAGIAVRNPAFDVTPAELVTALITERGVARPPFSESIAELLEAQRLQ